jgi:uncharacterized protein YcnI
MRMPSGGADHHHLDSDGDFMKYVHATALAAVLLATASGSAFAHITLETPTAPASGTYKAILRVPHGCAGAATTGLRVQIPEGVMEVKPMPKPGWAIAIKRAKLSKPYSSEGTTVTEGVVEIDWSGGSLPDDYYDEFVFRAKLPDSAGKTIHFPTIQVCGGTEIKWIEIPAEGQDADSLENPAPGVKLGAHTDNDD